MYSEGMMQDIYTDIHSKKVKMGILQHIYMLNYQQKNPKDNLSSTFELYFQHNQLE